MFEMPRISGGEGVTWR
jgi:hypothetical protein